MSFASDFGHDIPSDDWDGGYNIKKRNYVSRFTPSYPVTLSVILKKETDKAYLVNDGVGDRWLPKSETEFSFKTSKNQVVIPSWLQDQVIYIKRNN